jgi:uncharacterized protein YjbI with pentapeptide repeats
VKGKPPTSPYPPDPDDDARQPTAPDDDLLDATLEGLDWSNVRVPRFSARCTVLQRVRLTGAQISEGALIDVTFDACRADLAVFRFAKLHRVAFRDCRLDEADFYGAALTDVLFERCTLREATFSDAKAERVELRGCTLTGLQGVEALRGARMPWNDVLENAPLFAAALQIEVVDDA